MERDELGRYITDDFPWWHLGERKCFDPCHHIWRLSTNGEILKVWRVCFESVSTANQYRRRGDSRGKCRPGCPCAGWRSYAPGKGGTQV